MRDNRNGKLHGVAGAKAFGVHDVDKGQYFNMDRRFPPAVIRESVTAHIKWYNPVKGFGFVKSEEDEADAFLHASVLPPNEVQALPPGATVVCDLAQGQKGLMVATVHSIDRSTATEEDFGFSPREGDEESSGPLGPPQDGTVKFFNQAKGFGFIVPDDGSQDVFISARTLNRYGMISLESAQRVRIQSRPGDKGPTAEDIQLI